MEIYKELKDYPDYSVSNLGNVKSIKYKKEKILKQRHDRYGRYNYVVLRVNGKSKNVSIHRLVMKTFNPVENMDNLQVNHKDFNTHNNKLDNLEWMTTKENVEYSVKAGHYYNRNTFFKNKFGKEHNKSIVYVLKCPDGEVRTYYSGGEFKRLTGLNNTSLTYASKRKKLPYSFVGNRGMGGYTLLEVRNNDYKCKNK